ncbi:CSS-motif domain-containing protein [Enterobacter bugandensis]|uniref:CSS-motif domain-containing protein n=1 Tax=Enterobacter bugandensis TaxID=881260 RepID=UPI00389B14D8
MRTLIDAPCTSSTVAELRRILAITPHIGNIELARSGEVYWSSLLGVPPPGTEIREERSIYLTTGPPPLRVIPLSCFTCTRRAMGSIPAQTVTISATFWNLPQNFHPLYY